MVRRARPVDVNDAATRRAEKTIAAATARGSVPVSDLEELLAGYKRLLDKFHKVMVISDTYSAELKKTTEQLDQVRALTLPICMFCKKIRVDDEYWEQIDGYFAKHIDVAFTHGICPECMESRYGDLLAQPQGKALIAAEVQEKALAAKSKAIPDSDAALRAAEVLLASDQRDVVEVRSGLRKLADRYRRLLRRMGKILLISDGYQARLMDLNGKLNLLAHTDALTGLSNRHDAIEKLEAERSRAERHAGMFSLAIADIDDFKAVNDTQGHEAGDRLLSELGRVFRTTMRREDTSARWGGEEFLFLLPETDAAATERLLGKLLTAVKKMDIPFRGGNLRCTLSAGFSTFSVGDSVNDLLRRADAALYTAKEHGKDRVFFSPSDP